MNIWLLQTGEPLPINDSVRKMRTGLLADELVKRGHEVLWWVSAFEHQQKKWIYSDEQQVSLSKGLTLKILYGCGYKKNISLSRYIDHRIVATKFRQKAVFMEKPDVLVASMPCHHLAYEAVRYANLNSVTSLVDVRDLWPDIFLKKTNNKTLKKILKLFLYQDFSRLNYLLKESDGILAMSNYILDWALQKAGRSRNHKDNCFYLAYKKLPQPQAAIPPFLFCTENQKIVLYIGTFGHSYELSLILDVANEFNKIGRKDICFVLAGTGEQEHSLKHKLEDLNIKNVIFTGWIGSEEIKYLLTKAWLGLIPCDSINGAIPNKVFEYLSEGLPVISSLEGEMADVIRDFRLGYSYKVGDKDGLYNHILNLTDNPELHNLLSENALRFFDAYGSADKIYSDYADHIEALVRKKDP